MKKIVIGIHGLGNKPPASLLREWWVKSMQEGLKKIGSDHQTIPFALVFWADILHPLLLDPEISDPEDELYIKEPYVPGDPSFKPGPKSLKAKLFEYIDKQLDSIFLNEDMSLNLEAVTDKIIHTYFSDLEVYLHRDCVSVSDPRCIARHQIQDRLLEVLRKYAGHDIFLLSHSMGSIIAYDVLVDHAAELRINTFVTIGSALGLPFLNARELARQRQQYPELQRPVVPACIRTSWHNFSEPEDRVALDHTLSDDFTPNEQGVTVEDHSVYSDYKVGDVRNPHKSFGYLRTVEFAGVLDDFLTLADASTIPERFQAFMYRLRFKLLAVWKHKYSEK